MLGLAIAIHNIPEGLAIAVPVFHATKSKKKALAYTFLAGIVEPIGGVFAYLIFKDHMSKIFLSSILAMVAGIMIFISLDELLPACYECKEDHNSLFGIIIGMAIMAFSMYLFSL
jgi:ZIP family zinc transporter